MIFGIGLDAIDVKRIERQLSHEAGLMEQLFTPNEIAFCTSRVHAGPHFAARFAAKEAFLKALGTGWRGGIAFTDVEITVTPGQPCLALHGKARELCDHRGITKAHLSLAHPTSIASAIVILEI